MRNNSKAAAKRKQVVLSAPAKIKIGTKEVTAKSGIKTIVGAYKVNKDAKPIKTILHPLPPPTDFKAGEDAKTMGRITSAPELSKYQIERNKKRSEEREAKRNRKVLVVDGSRPFKGSIRNKFTGPRRNNQVI